MPDVDLSQHSAATGGSQPLRGYLSRPDGDGPWPGVVVVHEIFGLDDQTRRHADRLAAAGYLTLAVDLFSAGGARRCLVATMRAMLTGRGKAFADVEAARRHLVGTADCTGAVGVIGFCMGGASRCWPLRGLRASSVNYGMLPRDVDAAVAGACPVVAAYGGSDPMLRGAPERLDAALTRAGVPHDVKEYPGAGHSFLNDAEVGPRVLLPLWRVARMGPDPDSAADAWRRIEHFFDAHLR
jgi:carboxymethylenebutenolidase